MSEFYKITEEDGERYLRVLNFIERVVMGLDRLDRSNDAKMLFTMQDIYHVAKELNEELPQLDQSEQRVFQFIFRYLMLRVIKARGGEI